MTKIFVSLNSVNAYRTIRMWTKSNKSFMHRRSVTLEKSMDLLNRGTQIENISSMVYRKVQEANHWSLAYRNKYKLEKHLQFGQKFLLNFIIIHSGNQKNCASSNVDCTLWLKSLRKVITKWNSTQIQEGIKPSIAINSLKFFLVTKRYRTYCPTARNPITMMKPNTSITNMQKPTL